MKKIIIYLYFILQPLLAFSDYSNWMEDQIRTDFSYFEDKTLSLSALGRFYEEKGSICQLARYTILENEVTVDQSHVDAKKLKERIERYRDILIKLCETKGLPNTVLLISVNDGLNSKDEIPIFAMCKKDSNRIILIPDYEALGTRYQVLKKEGIDLTKKEFKWENKTSKLIWRGSTAQKYTRITNDNFSLFSRIKLCELSEKHPELIDAKFTSFVQGADLIPFLNRYKGQIVSFDQQMHYKYHILIDGNVTPYSKSGWKLFTNSLIFKPDSEWIQWYHRGLEPFVHYRPVKANLEDLEENILWAVENDSAAQKIAANCRKFAVNEFNYENHLNYLYQVIIKYSHLTFVP